MTRSTSVAVAAGLVAAAALAASAQAQTNVPKPSYKYEKCYGVSKAGQNDCFGVSNACGGTAKTDRQGDAWIYLPAGTCKKIPGGLTGPIKP